MSSPATQARTAVRCAIYTRKSTEEGLEQEFNTLDAQREAAEAYITSQRHEGWECLPDRFDDGGFTGGNIERPALQRLLNAIEAKRVDCVIVYKVDRLSRSLLDFSRLMDVFDRHGVSFVSVTQQFNTTHSMGRLTLNILLSFAQFEREIIAERTKDKMSAARRKGKWVGGIPVLGYDIQPDGGKLVVNDDEAAQVRTLFQLYLEHQGLVDLAQELNSRGWRSKRWVSAKGKVHGSKLYTKNILARILHNKKDGNPAPASRLMRTTLSRQLSSISEESVATVLSFRKHSLLARKKSLCNYECFRMNNRCSKNASRKLKSCCAIQPSSGIRNAL